VCYGIGELSKDTGEDIEANLANLYYYYAIYLG